MARNVNRTIETKEQPYHRNAITPIEYSGLQDAYDHFNAELFGGLLPDVFITYQRKAHSHGYFAPDRFSGRVDDESGRHELALNPDSFINQSDEFICSVLGHEQHHVWQHVEGKPSPRGYHNKEWAAKMKANGLQPSSTGMVGGKETGQHMAHYVIPGGSFARAFAKLAAKGWKLNLQSAHRPGAKGGNDSKTPFTCPACGQNAWGKPGLTVICTPCVIEALYDHPEVAGAITLIEPYQMRSKRTADAIAPDVSAPTPSYEIPEPSVAAIVPSIEPPPQNSAKRQRGRPKGSKNKKPETIAQAKPKRGRPKGSKNKPKDLPSYDATPSVERPVRKRGRPKGSKNKPKEFDAASPLA
jgi:SprT-like family